MDRLKKGILYSTIILIVIVVTLFALVSPISKFLIEKFDQKYIGREITMDWAFVNPFTGYLHFDNLNIYELKSDSIFISMNGLSADISLFKLMSKNYEISMLTLDQPKGIIFQNKAFFNFNDLISKFSSNEDSTKNSDPLHLSILNIKINSGEFYYRENITPINYFIKNVNIESLGFKWDVDTIPITFSFLSGIGEGKIEGNFTVNSKNKDYALAVQVQKFDLNILGQYIKNLSNYGSFSAFLDADFKSKGNFIDKDNVSASGLISINDFHFGKDSNEDFAAFENFTVSIQQIEPQKFIFLYDSISLKHPYLKYEKYDYLDNVQTMFGKNGSNVTNANADGAQFNLVIEIAKYIKKMSKNLLRSNYKIGRLAIYGGDILYTDYSLGEKFGVSLNPLNFIADSVEKSNRRVDFHLSSSIKPYGNIAVAISINPKDSSDFDLHYQIQKIPLTLFNPYLIKYTSFPVDRGTIEVNGIWKVRNGLIHSNNHLLVIDPRVGKKIKNNYTNWLPLRLVMFFVRERGNVIDYEIPILGDLNNPKFKLRDILFDALENLFIKPVTTVYRYEVKNIETVLEKSLALKWEMRKSDHSNSQEAFLERMAEFLYESPKATILVQPNVYELKEKEHILFYEGKKKYYMNLKGMNIHSYYKRDSILVEKLSIKNPEFIKYLNAHVHDSLEFTVQGKLIALIGAKTVNAKFKTLNRDRLNKFMFYFMENGTENRVKVTPAQPVVPYNGFSFYKIIYKGEYPDYLLKAYNKMNELNNEKPRKKYRKMRQKIGKK